MIECRGPLDLRGCPKLFDVDQPTPRPNDGYAREPAMGARAEMPVHIPDQIPLAVVEPEKVPWHHGRSSYQRGHRGVDADPVVRRLLVQRQRGHGVLLCMFVELTGIEPVASGLQI